MDRKKIERDCSVMNLGREEFTSFMTFLLEGLQQGYFRSAIEDFISTFRENDE